MQIRKDITRGRINGAAAARDTNSELLPLARPPPPRGRPESGLAHRRPPSTPTRGVPSGHLGGAVTPFLAHWLHHDGHGGGQPLVVHLRREEEVISADDGHAESGCSAEEGAQRVAAARLGAGRMARGGGTPACPRSSQSRVPRLHSPVGALCFSRHSCDLGPPSSAAHALSGLPDGAGLVPMDPAEVPDQSEPRRRAARDHTSQLFEGPEDGASRE